jgi:hypothetical protein
MLYQNLLISSLQGKKVGNFMAGGYKKAKEKSTNSSRSSP